MGDFVWSTWKSKSKANSKPIQFKFPHTKENMLWLIADDVTDFFCYVFCPMYLGHWKWWERNPMSNHTAYWICDLWIYIFYVEVTFFFFGRKISGEKIPNNCCLSQIPASGDSILFSVSGFRFYFLGLSRTPVNSTKFTNVECRVYYHWAAGILWQQKRDRKRDDVNDNAFFFFCFRCHFEKISV